MSKHLRPWGRHVIPEPIEDIPNKAAFCSVDQTALTVEAWSGHGVPGWPTEFSCDNCGRHYTPDGIGWLVK
jgi:hypothetical protein